MCHVVLSRFDKQFLFSNIYAPNNYDLNFLSATFNDIVEIQLSFPGAHIVLGGDFNLTLSALDSVNRNISNNEQQCRKLFKRNVDRLDLLDSYRILHPKRGFTWARGKCMSRLDMIFVSKELAEDMSSSKLNWAFDDSDHALLESNFLIKPIIVKGPGLTRINTSILDNDLALNKVREELKIQINQIPTHWNPHMKLEFVKTAIRSIVSSVAGNVKKAENLEQEAISEQLNILIATKEKLENGDLVNPDLSEEIEHTITLLEAERNRYLNQVSERLSMKAKVKWYEEGERSNKYFLNLIKRRSEQQLITKLIDQNIVHDSQDDIMEHATDFYKKLYDHKETADNFDELFVDLPQLTEQEKEYLDRQITLDELWEVLRGCEESAPGPDGITYNVYKKLWSEIGPFLLESWKYSVSVKLLPLDQRVSAITLLPKNGKPKDRIENWRPITLSNCDLKMFTKLISNRVSKVLNRIIHPSQTAYIPGRVVHDNLRMFEFYNNYCKEKNVDAVLISLDAKKAFDSVSHKYLHKVLKAYGFSDNFIETVQLLYKDIKANILINGYKSVNRSTDS